MKWVLAVSFIVCLATLSRGSALGCRSGLNQDSSSSESSEKGQGCTLGTDDKSSSSSSSSESREEDTTQPSNKVKDENTKAECLAGTQWESNCHKCRCSKEGHSSCKKIDSCEEGSTEKPIPCKPQTTFKRDCNTCVCLENGLGLCTVKDCEALKDSIVKDVNFGIACLPGSEWKSRCNSCNCSADGYPSCTVLDCPGQESEPEYKCAPKSYWKNDCNSCWCSEKGVPMCTRMGCRNETGVIDFNPDGNDGIADIPQPDPEIHKIQHNIVKRAASCKPNASIKTDCNLCLCALDGKSFTCTFNDCVDKDISEDVEVFMESEAMDGTERTSVCKPRGTFYIGCNTCHCNFDGTDYTCTNRPCPLPDDVEIFHELKAIKTAPKNKEVVCTANRMFIKDCNTCWCNEDGTSYFCTRKVCVIDLPEDVTEQKPEDLQEIKRKCRPDEVFELDCNMCRCNTDGMSFSCTRRICVPEDKEKNIVKRKVRATPQGPPKACQPGQEFRMDCNQCLCDNEGKDFSCTRIDCLALNNGNVGVRTKRETHTSGNVATQLKTDCEPGSVFKQGCNVCRCTSDGNHATCTLKVCKHDNSEEEENELSESDPGFRCNPGEQFKRGCNDCTCSADGKSVFCTLRLCEQDILSPSI